MVSLYATRNDLLALLPPEAVIAELGVFEGEFSVELLRLKPKELYLVDLWRGPMQCGDKDGLNIKTLSDAEMQKVYRKLWRKYESDDRVHLMRYDVGEALAGFPDGYFDFIYVDADHRYEAVKAHLEASAVKVKPGGLLGGHDYGMPYLGVVRAVNEFATHFNFEWVGLTQDGCPSFLLRRTA